MASVSISPSSVTGFYPQTLCLNGQYTGPPDPTSYEWRLDGVEIGHGTDIDLVGSTYMVPGPSISINNDSAHTIILTMFSSGSPVSDTVNISQGALSDFSSQSFAAHINCIRSSWRKSISGYKPDPVILSPSTANNQITVSWDMNQGASNYDVSIEIKGIVSSENIVSWNVDWGDSSSDSQSGLNVKSFSSTLNHSYTGSDGSKTILLTVTRDSGAPINSTSSIQLNSVKSDLIDASQFSIERGVIVNGFSFYKRKKIADWRPVSTTLSVKSFDDFLLIPGLKYLYKMRFRKIGFDGRVEATSNYSDYSELIL